MAHEHGGALFECVQETHGVPDGVQQGVFLDAVGAIGAAVAALVGGYGMESRGGQCGQLMTPGVPRLGEAVEQHDQWARSCLGQVHTQAADAEVPVGNAGK
ncbi:hypothetical protein GCM10009863_34960 [Streptomyces axinellae]|uniref:Uncharacterized protein n=1 Tax=Streptomyces axinellae TaxID=552788 RepID=A0ABN3Q671_9ACTN